eukprot:6895349-Alexandrium_andersonii.AAC.1
MKRLLQRTWNADRFGEDRAEPVARKKRHVGDIVERVKVTEAIANPKFWAYCDMLWLVHSLIERGSWWAEGCCCHPVDLEQNEQELSH